MEKEVKVNIFKISRGTICDYCFREFDVLWEKTKNEGVEYVHLYLYNEHLKTNLYRLKGLGDIELAPVFIERFVSLLKVKYFNHVLVSAPSAIESETERGYNHVEKLFSSLNRPFLVLFRKKFDFKQSDLNYAARQNVIHKIEVINGERVKNKHILIVDDLHTTGATIRAMISLIRPFKPKSIKVLTIAKTADDF